MNGDWASRPYVKARDLDREYAMGLLRNASADGQLTGVEFDERLRAAMRARTLGELATLVGDLQSRPEPRHEVPVLPVAPHPYIYAPARPIRPRVRWFVVLGAGILALLLAMVALATGSSPASLSSSGPAVVPAPEPDPCTGVIGAAVDMTKCVSAANPLASEGLSDRAASGQKGLDLPGNLPVPRRAEFVRPGWVSATYNENGRQQITRRWHLEYVLADHGGVTAGHLAEIYKSTVGPATFGTFSDQGALDDGAIQLRWTGGAYPLTVAIVREPSRWRVRLDVSVEAQTSIPRPDVSGEFRQQLKVQRTATVPGMMYESSRVTWTSDTSCRLEQVWSATPDQVAQIGKQARDLGTTIETKPEGGMRLVFQSVLRDCTTFQL
jgi:hypothetical protein